MSYARLWIICGVLGGGLWLAQADETSPAKPFFLPKSPVAAAYVLGRLSNQELTAAPRSEFVYVALLQRAGLARKYRVEALNGLAKLRQTDALTELLAGLTELDTKGATAEPVLHDLAPLLLQSDADALKAKSATLAQLTQTAKLPFTRQLAYAALLTIEGADGPTWQQTSAHPGQFADLVSGIALLRDPNQRAAFHLQLAALLQAAELPEVRRAAISSSVTLPGSEAEVFNTLAGLVRAGTERATAIAALQKIPRSFWSRDQLEPLVTSLVAYLQTVPVEQRTGPEALSAFQFATDLTGLLPTETAATFGRTLRSLGVSVFVIRTIPEQMLYDQSLIVVAVGKPVELVLINDDAMPHNLVITQPEALEAIGSAAERLPPTPDAQGRLYVPNSPQVLHATKLVEFGQQARLSFTAPDAPGDYHFVCTFPGHWRRMNGTLAVVQDVEAYLASHAAQKTPQMTEWKIEELTPALTKLNSGRDWRRGQELFTQLSCASCHRIGNEGATFGPDLTSVFAQFQNDPRAVLQQILEPSLVISNAYRAFDFELADGEEISGLIVKDDGQSLTVQAGASAALTHTFAKAQIKTQQPQRSSLMPVGLLNQSSAEDILDLLAFIKAGGTPAEHSHQP